MDASFQGKQSISASSWGCGGGLDVRLLPWALLPAILKFDLFGVNTLRKTTLAALTSLRGSRAISNAPLK